MKKLLPALLMVLAWLAISSSPAKAEDIAIRNCTDLQNMRKNPSSRYYLTNNIDCSATKNSGEGFIPFSFSGMLDGRCYIISNLYENIYRTAPDISTDLPVGLFLKLESATVKNLGLENADISVTFNSKSYGSVGVLAGESYNSHIENVYILNSKASVSAPSDAINVHMAGGMIGAIYNTDIKNSFVKNSTIKGGSNAIIGGLVGRLDGNVSNSYSYNNQILADYTAGGISGYMWQDDGSGLSNLISVKNYLTSGLDGGLIGFVPSKLIINNLYSADITNKLHEFDVGGTFGRVDTDDLIFNGKMYWSPTDTTNVCVGFYMPNVTTATKTTVANNCVMKDMKASDWYNTTTAAPLDKWDFVNVWKTNANDLPTLKCFDRATEAPKSTGSINCHDKLSDYAYLSGFGDKTLDDIVNDDFQLRRLIDQAAIAGKNIGECKYLEHWNTGYFYIYSYKKCGKVSPDPDQRWTQTQAMVTGSSEGPINPLLKEYMLKAIKEGWCCCNNCKKSALGPIGDDKLSSFQNDMSVLYGQYFTINELLAAAQQLVTQYQSSPTNAATSSSTAVITELDGTPVTVKTLTLYKVEGSYYYFKKSVLEKVSNLTALQALVKNNKYKNYNQNLLWSPAVKQKVEIKAKQIRDEAANSPYTPDQLNFISNPPLNIANVIL